MQFHDILEIPEGNTQRYINVEVEQVKQSEEDKYFNLSDKWIKQEQYGWNHDCKGPNMDTR